MIAIATFGVAASSYGHVRVATCPPGEKELVCILVSDVISKADVAPLGRLLSLRPGVFSIVFLNSAGGDVDAAMALGRLLRANQSMAFVLESSSCLSSCVLVYAGGSRRISHGKLGIHRPYMEDVVGKNYASIQRAHAELATRVKSYLTEMNVLPQLYDAMATTAPQSIRYLSDEDQFRYGLGAIDPIEQEIQDAKDAKQYGIGKQEYLRRRGLVADICVPLFSNMAEVWASKEKGLLYEACSEDVLRGLRSR